MASDTVARAYSGLQSLISATFSSPPPPPGTKLRQPKIAIIGAGLTGVSAASHCVGHGFDVTIFEADGSDHVGGIWAKVNSTSGLQIHSLMYRFHPSVSFEDDYPKQGQIVREIRKLWRNYGLEKKTKFHTKVTKIYKDQDGLWIVNDPSNGKFHGVIPAIGTCGPPNMPSFQGQESFKGEIIHSSELDGKSAQGRNVVVIGGGASAIEALQWAADTDAAHIKIIARSEKWIIPRNLIIDTLLSCNFSGFGALTGWLPEALVRTLFYRDLKEIAPSSDHGLYTETPMVDNDTFRLIRSGKAEWLRGDIIEFSDHGVTLNHRRSGMPKGAKGEPKSVDADFIVLATGYKRPSLSFLPEEVFNAPYAAPRWYLQCFPTQYPSICCANSTYIEGIGSVGNWHIGMYTRLLLVFLLDPFVAPSTWWMQRWVDMTTLLKAMAPTNALDFFTYPELISWFVFVVLINPFRWKWAFFVLFGWSMPFIPQSSVEQPASKEAPVKQPSSDKESVKQPSIEEQFVKQSPPTKQSSVKQPFAKQPSSKYDKILTNGIEKLTNGQPEQVGVTA